MRLWNKFVINAVFRSGHVKASDVSDRGQREHDAAQIAALALCTRLPNADSIPRNAGLLKLDSAIAAERNERRKLFPADRVELRLPPTHEYELAAALPRLRDRTVCLAGRAASYHHNKRVGEIKNSVEIGISVLFKKSHVSLL